MTLPLEWFRAEAARQRLPLDEEDLQAIAEFVNQARQSLDVHRPRDTDGLEPSSLSHPKDEGRDAANRALPGDWVRIHRVVLEAGARAPGIPPDTASTPYQMWVNGWAAEAARVGDAVTIRTVAGREMRGRLVEIDPGYHQTFGRPHRALLAVGRSLRLLIRGRDA